MPLMAIVNVCRSCSPHSMKQNSKTIAAVRNAFTFRVLCLDILTPVF